MTTATKKPPKTELKRFRILGGRHQTGKGRYTSCQNYAARGRNGELRKDSSGETLSDIIETDKDLVKLFGSKKFVRLHNNSMDRDLDKLTLEELISLAENEEIDIGDSTKKVDVLSKIQTALG